MKYFQEHGYALLRQVIPEDALQNIKRELHELVGKHSTLEADILACESESHQKLYDASITVGSSLAAYDLIGRSGVWALAGQALEAGPRLHVTPLHIAVQLPRVTAFDYAPHRERDFYPWAPSLLNLWFPVAASTGYGTGTISLIPGSHKRLDRAVTKVNADSFIQLIPELSEGEESKFVSIDADPGDLLVFHKDMVHKSLPNVSNVPRVTGILRVMDMAKMEARPLYKSLSYIT